MTTLKNLTQDDFLRAATENLYWASTGEQIIKVVIPGAGTATILSEQEYEYLKNTVTACQEEGLI
jgi:hypothetical protein